MESTQARQRLDEERSRLESIRGELDTIRIESGGDSAQELSSYDQHPADAGTETFDREKDLSILDQVEGDLAEVTHALERLDDGSYGTCEACGKPIGDERLEAMPATRFCIDDQASAERELRSGAPAEGSDESTDESTDAAEAPER